MVSDTLFELCFSGPVLMFNRPPPHAAMQRMKELQLKQEEQIRMAREHAQQRELLQQQQLEQQRLDEQQQRLQYHNNTPEAHFDDSVPAAGYGDVLLSVCTTSFGFFCTFPLNGKHAATTF